ncbi:MAG: hypothetical protein V9H69_05555 [Anaerolineae bacterium]|jgi:hypothetical protein
MSDAITDWVLGFIGFGVIWLVVFPRQRYSRLTSDAAPIPTWLAWISGYPRTPTVDPGSFGAQFYAVSLLIVNSILVLLVAEHDDRIAWLSLALVVNLLIAWLIAEWLRRQRVVAR